MTANRLFEETQNRAFMLAGYYPLTYGTIGPVSINDADSALVTCVAIAIDTNTALLNKYLTYLFTVILVTTNYL